MSSNGGLPGMRPDQLALLAARSVAGSGPAPQSNVLVNPVIIITPGRAVLVYSPGPGPGNLIASLSAVEGSDRYGNVYLAGTTTYTGNNVTGWIATSLQGGTVVYYWATSEAGPWTIAGSIGTIVGFPYLFLIQFGASRIFPAGVVAYVAPSGDHTGVTDSATMLEAMSIAGTVQLLPGAAYFWSAPTKFTISGQQLIGNGATVNAAGAGWAGQPMLALANTSVLETVTTGVNFNCSSLAANAILLNNGGQGGHIVEKNYITVPTSDGIFLATCRDSKINKNLIYNCNGGNGINAAGSDMQITGNVIGEVLGHGILITGPNNQVNDNKCYEAGWDGSGFTGTTSCGIYCNSPYNQINNNSCQQNALHGIELDGTTGTGASLCTVTGNEVDTNSTATANVGSGIFLNQATFCIVTGTTGGNNTGLGLGSQLWGIQMSGACTGTVAYPNVVGGSAGPFSGATSWTAPTLATGFAAGSVTPGYRAEGSIVRLRGVVNLSANQPAFTTIFTLPGGLVPNQPQTFSTAHNLSGFVSGTTFGTISVTNTGAVELVPSGTSGESVSLAGIWIELD